ncbi:MAG: sulfatase [Alphaproteobacteria bacterium]|nr:sulfatase [Alphaproteobacteria bacterium]
MERRQFLGATAATVAALTVNGEAIGQIRRKPNFIIVLCDDLGWGDIEPDGGSAIPTPNINRMAAQGNVLTDYYAPQNICTPSRAGLLTGRYAIRTGLGYSVILPNDERRLPLSEVTIPAALKPAGYVSALFGKWHLGHTGPSWQPTRHGFDQFFGLQYSHDMKPLWLYTDNGRDQEPAREAVIEDQLQERFYAAAERFITDHADRPFFVELALSAPHLPNYPDARFRDKSMQGAYADTVVEIDTIVGRLMERLKALGIERDTLMIFTSDNGPWYEGSTGGLRDRKGGAAYDGGYRVPCIACQPGVVKAGQRTHSIAMGIDFLPTFCAMAGISGPQGVELDGRDISALLTRGAASPHDQLLLFNDEDVVAIRTQRWKYATRSHYRGSLASTENVGYPQLFDISKDISENYSVAQVYPDALADMQERMKAARAQFGPLKAKQPPKVFRDRLVQSLKEQLSQD